MFENGAMPAKFSSMGARLKRGVRPMRMARRRHVRRHTVGIAAALVVTEFFLGPSFLRAADHQASGGCGWTQYGNYNPRKPRSLDDIPQPIRSDLLAHVKARVGAALFENISFAGGQIVDLAALRVVEPDSKNYRWVVPAYNLFFQLRLPGGDVYCASVKLDDKGTILQEIELPAAASDSTKAQLVSREEATAVARTRAVPVAKARIEMRYFRDTDTLEWLFGFHSAEHGSWFSGRCLHVPADDPERCHWSEFEGGY